jgi:hypothetical protein
MATYLWQTHVFWDDLSYMFSFEKHIIRVVKQLYLDQPIFIDYEDKMIHDQSLYKRSTIALCIFLARSYI